MSGHDNEKQKDKNDVKQKEWERLAAMIAEAKRHEEIAKAQEVFEPVYREIQRQRSRNKNSLKQTQGQGQRRKAIACGIITVRQAEGLLEW